MPKFSRLSLLAAGGAALLLASSAWAQSGAGVVRNVRGDVHIVRDGQTLPVEVNAEVQPMDRIVTGRTGRVGVTFQDNTRIALGGRSSVVVEEYAFNATDNSGSFALRMLKGTLSAITGLLSKNPDNLREVRTRTATAGIRGTEFVVHVPQTEED